MNRLGGIVATLATLLVLEVAGPGLASHAPVSTAPAQAASLPPTATVQTSGSLGRFKVRPRDLGIHANSVKPDAPVGALRLNCLPLWSQVNPARGEFDWTYMDALVDRATVQWGYSDVVFSFCGTPQWAGAPVPRPDQEVFGPGSTSPPRYMRDWAAFVTAVVKRYKGRITAYQAWNEPTTDQFFQGTPKRMALMTRRLDRIVARHDPDALVVGASLQWFNSSTRAWGAKYLRLLRGYGWPIDVYSFHGYGPTNSLANGRQSVIRSFRQQLASLRAPSRPIWDTELTYKTTDPLSARLQGALVIRSYLDAWRMGIRRTYWYAWTQSETSFGSVQMQSGTAAAKALERFSSSVIGAKYRGCSEASNGLVRCRFTKSGRVFTIMWAEGRAVVVKRTRTMRYQNLVTGSSSRSRRIKVGAMPILVKGRA